MLKSGIYGKLPAKGDFISRRLSHHFIDIFDVWLRTGMESSKQNLGERWLDTFLTSPVWHFALSRHICGDNAYMGIMMPSVDKIGRYFPFIVAAEVEENAMPIELFSDYDLWFEAAEKMALNWLGTGDFDQDEDARLVRMDEIDRNQQAISGITAYRQPFSIPAWGLTFDKQTQLCENLQQCQGRILQDLLGAYSIWVLSGSNDINNQAYFCQGLPTTELFTKLLEGEIKTHDMAVC